MSKEYDFHKIIENQNKEEKQEIWKKIEARDCNGCENVESQGNVLALSKNKQFYLKIFIPVFAAILIAGIILLSYFLVKKSNTISIRYCVSDEYYFEQVDTSIEQYASNNGKELLYFDWYKESEYYVDHQYRLNTTNEVVCLREELVDENGVYIVQHITDQNIQLDFLDFHKTNCKEKVIIKSYEVYWSSDSLTGEKAYFVYNNHVYYLSIEATNDMGFILSLVEDLIK